MTDVNNAFFGYGGRLGAPLSGEAGFTLYRLLVLVSVPAGAGPVANPLSPATPPKPSTNPH